MLLLMMTSVVLSQSIKKDSVTVGKKTFRYIMKESRKCDSVKIAFNKKSILLQSLIKNNLQMFNDLELERIKREQLQIQLQKTNKSLLKLSKKRNNGSLYGIGGVVIGIITYSLVN
ncbi:hypothetical protein TMP227_10110 [Tenacibaculum maritimum]|nr:hypothetical protein TMP227_10110 [Tenacibaculum maritimum]